MAVSVMWEEQILPNRLRERIHRNSGRNDRSAGCVRRGQCLADRARLSRRVRLDPADRRYSRNLEETNSTARVLWVCSRSAQSVNGHDAVWAREPQSAGGKKAWLDANDRTPDP